MLDKFVRFRICSQHRVFALPCTDEKIQINYRKKLEEMDFVVEEFLHKKINKKDVYMWIIV